MAKKYNPVKALTDRIEDLDKNEKSELIEHVLGIAESEAAKRRKEIQFGYMPDLYKEIEE